MSSKRLSRKLRQRVAERARWRREYCLSPAAFSTQPLEVDHIVPRSKRGPSTLANLALSCGCNVFKGARTQARDPQTNRLAPLFNPRRQPWGRHFVWTEDLLQIVGLTPTGRATVVALHLNRLELINLRRLLVRIGEHPPAAQ